MRHNSVDTLEAQQYFKNYLKKYGKVDDGFLQKKHNTAFLTIREAELQALTDKYKTALGSAYAGIRIYPMIYPKDYGHGKSNMLNILIVALKKPDSNDTSHLSLVEVPTLPSDGPTLSSNKYSIIYKIVTDNQIGQCPPGDCNVPGAILYRSVINQMVKEDLEEQEEL